LWSAAASDAVGEPIPLDDIRPSASMLRTPQPPTTGTAIAGARGQSGPALVYLNFTGATITEGPRDDATANVSAISTVPDATLAPFNAAAFPCAPSQTAAILQIVTFVQQKYAPFDVTFTTTRPAAGPYTEAIIGGNPGDIGQQCGVAGVALLDCFNREPDNVVFIFSASLPDLQSVAIDVAHELGHSFGAVHTDNLLDIMHTTLDPTQTDFLWGQNPDNVRCTDAPFQESAAVLLDDLGPPPGTAPEDLGPPVIDLTWPPEGASVPASFSLRAEAYDDTALMGVEMLRDGIPVEEALAPPWNLPERGAVTGPHLYDLRAIDTSGNITDVNVDLSVGTGPAPQTPCAASEDCSSGLVCVQGQCAMPTPGGIGAPCQMGFNCTTNHCDSADGVAGVCTGACQRSSDCASQSCLGGTCAAFPPADLHGGCSVGGAPTDPWAILLLMSVAIGLCGACGRRSRPAR
jgi:hypothetical protein